MQSTKAGKTVSTESQFDMQMKLNLITKHATEDAKFKFTSLVHLLNETSLKECFRMLEKGKATGVDNVTYEEYEQYLNTNIQKLVNRMKEGKYYPQPARRVYIPKGEGKVRPLGIPSLEDKIVQMGITRILNAIYEPNFLESSYGYRKGRGCHLALKQLNNAVMTKPINHIIDADIRGFFDNVNHEWLMKMLEEKMQDKNLLKLIKRFLKAGVMEDGVRIIRDVSVPQGGLISPVLSNVYLHYVLDLWIEKKVKRETKGFVELIRYCDDFVVLTQNKEDAEMVLKAINERLNKFGLDLSQEKTRVIEFGRYARQNAEKRHVKSSTFDFLGFTHFCDKSRKGNFKVGRRTRKKKLNEKLVEMNDWLKGTRNSGKIKEWWKTLEAKLRGHYQYYGVSGNYASINKFYFETCRLVFKWINRRSQKRSMNLKEFDRYLQRYPLPKPQIKHNFYFQWEHVREY